MTWVQVQLYLTHTKARGWYKSHRQKEILATEANLITTVSTRTWLHATITLSRLGDVQMTNACKAFSYKQIKIS